MSNGDLNWIVNFIWGIADYAEAHDPIQLLQLPEPVTVSDFAERHHCGFWARMGGSR